MKTNSKYIVIVLVLLFSFILFQITTWNNLELKTKALKDIYTYFALLIYSILFISFYYLLPNNQFKEVVKSLGIFGLIILVLFIGFYLIPWNRDDEYDYKTLFVNKSDTSLKIVERIYYTGITADHENFDIVETREFFKNVNWTKTIDTIKLDKSEWFKVKNENQVH